MSHYEDYRERFQCVEMERRNGVLELTLHTQGDSLRWSLAVHSELPEVFRVVGDDAENKVVILTGCGAEFTGPRVTTDRPALFPNGFKYDLADRIIREGKALLMNFLEIDVPIVAAINGPAWRHGELPLLADIVLAADTASLQDSAHFGAGLVPGDGMHVVMPLLLGANRGRHFLITGDTIDAHKACELGLYAEVLPASQLRARAWEVAEKIARRPASLVRRTRALLNEPIKRQMQELLGMGLQVEMLALAGLDS